MSKVIEKFEVFVPLTPWCTGKSTELQNAMDKFVRESGYILFGSVVTDVYIYYRYTNFDGKEVLFIFESPDVINTFFDTLGYRQFDNTDQRQLLADLVWHDYMMRCIIKSGVVMKSNLRVYCDFHPFSGTRYRQLNTGKFSFSPIVTPQFCLTEYAFVPEGYDTPVYFAGPFGKRTPETRGHVDIDAADEIPLRMIENIPPDMYVRRIL